MARPRPTLYFRLVRKQRAAEQIATANNLILDGKMPRLGALARSSPIKYNYLIFKYFISSRFTTNVLGYTLVNIKFNINNFRLISGAIAIYPDIQR